MAAIHGPLLHAREPLAEDTPELRLCPVHGLFVSTRYPLVFPESSRAAALVKGQQMVPLGPAFIA
jgi:hypothetical protein